MKELLAKRVQYRDRSLHIIAQDQVLGFLRSCVQLSGQGKQIPWGHDQDKEQQEKGQQGDPVAHQGELGSSGHGCPSFTFTENTPAPYFALHCRCRVSPMRNA